MKKLIILLSIILFTGMSFNQAPEEFYRLDWYDDDVWYESSYCYSDEMMDHINQLCNNPYDYCVWYIWDESRQCWIFGEYCYCDETTN